MCTKGKLANSVDTVEHSARSFFQCTATIALWKKWFSARNLRKIAATNKVNAVVPLVSLNFVDLTETDALK